MSILIWSVIAFAGAAGLWFFAIRPGLPRFRKCMEGGQAGLIDEPGVTCTETCEIHSKLGDLIAYDCGHHDAPEFCLDLFGETRIHKKPGPLKLLCSECMLKKLVPDTIRCGSCGFSIMPGDPISLCVDEPKIGNKAWKTVFDGQLALCLRWECGAGPGYCGHWTGKGIKPAFADGGNQISQAFKTGEQVYTEIGPLDDSEPPSE